MSKATTITEAQARQLAATNHFNPAGLAGFVKVPGGFVSTHTAAERTLLDPDFPQKNALAVAKEQHEAERPQREAVARADAQVRSEREASRKAAEAQSAAYAARARREHDQLAAQHGIHTV